MKYLSSSDIDSICIPWFDLFSAIRSTAEIYCQGQTCQPIKPYLKFSNPHNRIISMPAYIGGQIELAGIKWIASFPDNISEGVPRAHSLTILNNSQTGVPLAVLNSQKVSGIRTAAVTGSMLQRLKKVYSINNPVIGICGFGPIGQLHADMVQELFPELKSLLVYDPKYSTKEKDSSIQFKPSWVDVYNQSDIFITCTNTYFPYIDKMPKKGSYHMNISLRDYKPDIIASSSPIFVDKWDEVCREKTNIEQVHYQYGIQNKDTLSFMEFIACRELFKVPEIKTFLSFHPMGMAMFDVAIADCYLKKAEQYKVGTELPL